MKKIPADFVPQHRGDSLLERAGRGVRGRLRTGVRRPLIAAVAVAMVAFGLSACEDGGSPAQQRGEKQAQSTFEQQEKAVPFPAAELRNSLERTNARKRLLRTNDPKKIGYVYLLSFGKIMGYYTIMGKVTGVGTQMKTSTTVERHSGTNNGGNVTYPGPRDDGTYGQTGGMGIYFFTSEDIMVTTTLDYIWSDEVLPIDVPRLDS